QKTLIISCVIPRNLREFFLPRRLAELHGIFSNLLLNQNIHNLLRISGIVCAVNNKVFVFVKISQLTYPFTFEKIYAASGGAFQITYFYGPVCIFVVFV